MKKIACSGYHATGSGVIDDLFREFDNVAQGYYEAESMFLQAPDGLSDLEFHLVENPNRLNTGIAIERFLRYVKDQRRMYNKIFGPEWEDICHEFIDSISKFQYIGYHVPQLMVKRPFTKYMILFHKVVNRLRPQMCRKPVWYDYFPYEREYHASIEENEFLEKTRNFMEKLSSKIPANDKTEFVLFDQLIGVDNPNRYMRYVKDLKTIIVDRDPRDLYIHHEIHGDHALPKRNPYQFSVHYRDIRKRKYDTDPSNVLFVTFEDMIYNYEKMVKKVIDFVGISSEHHVAPMTHFVPSISKQGTRLWERYPQYNDAIKVIEQELPEFLYNYDEGK